MRRAEYWTIDEKPGWQFVVVGEAEDVVDCTVPRDDGSLLPLDVLLDSFAQVAEEDGIAWVGGPSAKKRWYWLLPDGSLWWDTERHDKEDALVLVQDVLLRRRRRVERASARLSVASTPRQREVLPDDVKMFVWRRDDGRCVRCGSQEDLEFDHIIPVVMGGSNTARNLQLLCGTCNRDKGGNIV
jgi:hypothetical protein